MVIDLLADPEGMCGFGHPCCLDRRPVRHKRTGWPGDGVTRMTATASMLRVTVPHFWPAALRLPRRNGRLQPVGLRPVNVSAANLVGNQGMRS